MIKIAICGKAKSGKSTLGKFIANEFCVNELYNKDFNYKLAAFADPIKQIIKIMFPQTKKSDLFGFSENRNKIIQNAHFEQQPLTYRKLLQYIGTEVGQSLNKEIWTNIMQNKLEKADKDKISLFIITDLRFIHEYNFLKQNNFFIIKIIRGDQTGMTHSSETQQDIMPNNNFDIIINNNGLLSDLKSYAAKIYTKTHY